MGVRPEFYLAEFETGALIDTLPLENVRLESRLIPGQFSADLDLRKTGLPVATARALLEQMKHGRASVVPIREDGDIPIAMGEWWISKVAGSYASPIVKISGPEFAGYTSHLVNAEPWKGAMNPIRALLLMLDDAFRYSQNIVVTLGEWPLDGPAVVDVDVPEGTLDYLSMIQDLEANQGDPFEWVMRPGLLMSGARPMEPGGVPARVTRTLDIGRPRLSVTRDDVTLELSAPGLPPASLIDASWGWDEAASVTDLIGYGSGKGADQRGPVNEARPRAAGEPGKSKAMTDPSAMTLDQLRRRTRAALARFTPEEKTSTAVVSADRIIPRVGEVYQWRSDETRTRAAEIGTVRCVGWSWSSVVPTQYELDIVR